MGEITRIKFYYYTLLLLSCTFSKCYVGVLYPETHLNGIKKKKTLSSRLKYQDNFGVSVAWAHTFWAPSAILPCSSILLQQLLRDDGPRAMGEKAAELKPLFFYYTSQHVHEVLCGVLYPEVHYNRFQKKKHPEALMLIGNGIGVGQSTGLSGLSAP